jgi:hypothetical protein
MAVQSFLDPDYGASQVHAAILATKAVGSAAKALHGGTGQT